VTWRFARRFSSACSAASFLSLLILFGKVMVVMRM
jgi:hypothetical protein